MKIIHVDNIAYSLEDVEWEYNFEIILHKDGSASLKIPSFILKDLKWAIEDGVPTSEDQLITKRINRFPF